MNASCSALRVRRTRRSPTESPGFRTIRPFCSESDISSPLVVDGITGQSLVLNTMFENLLNVSSSNRMEKMLMGTMPTYVWAMVVAGLLGTTAAISVLLFRGAVAAGPGPGPATRVAGGSAILWGAWVLVSVWLADAEVYRFEPTRPVPLLPIALIGALG